MMLSWRWICIGQPLPTWVKIDSPASMARLRSSSERDATDLIDASFIIGVGIALWFTTANPFLAQLAQIAAK